MLSAADRKKLINDILISHRAEGKSYEDISEFLHTNYGIDITRNGLWAKYKRIAQTEGIEAITGENTGRAVDETIATLSCLGHSDKEIYAACHSDNVTDSIGFSKVTIQRVQSVTKNSELIQKTKGELTARVSGLMLFGADRRMLENSLGAIGLKPKTKVLDSLIFDGSIVVVRSKTYDTLEAYTRKAVSDFMNMTGKENLCNELKEKCLEIIK